MLFTDGSKASSGVVAATYVTTLPSQFSILSGSNIKSAAIYIENSLGNNWKHAVIITLIRMRQSLTSVIREFKIKIQNAKEIKLRFYTPIIRNVHFY